LVAGVDGLIGFLWEPTPVGDGFKGVCHAQRPRGGLLQRYRQQQAVKKSFRILTNQFYKGKIK
jgi:hypothetical protein